MFKIIPCAAPQVNDIRWRPSQPSTNWTDICDVSRFGQTCLQPPFFKLANELAPGNKNCLKLGECVPKDGNELSVPVWVHIGVLLSGFTIEPYHTPASLVAEGMITVTL